MTSEPAAEKNRLRRELLATRAAAFEAAPATGDRLFEHLEALLPPAPAVVSAYWPMRGELDTRPAMATLAGLGHSVCLPVTVAPHSPLRFRAWAPGQRLVPGGFGTQVPSPEEEELTPSVLLVPLVGFDDEGYRLGYGGGFYDRTLAQLRAAGPALAIGLGYAAQRVGRLPREATDQRLDWIVTELGAQAVEPALSV